MFGTQQPDLLAWLIVISLMGWIFLRGVFR